MADDSKPRALRSDAPSASNSPNDPLAELARLIGQDGLFDQMRKDAVRGGHGAPHAATRAAPELGAPARSRAAPQDDEQQDDGPQDYDLRGSFTPHSPNPSMRAAHFDAPEPRARSSRASHPVEGEPRAAEDQYEDRYQARETEYDARYAASAAHRGHGGYAAEHGDHQHYAEAPAGAAAYDDRAYDPAYDPAYAHEQDYAEEPLTERRRGGMMMVAAVLGLAVVGTAGAFAYRSLSGPGGSEPPVIQASGSPAKVTPSPQAREQGRSGFDRAGGPQQERVVSREEQPVELKEPRTSAPRMLASNGPATTGMIGSTGSASNAMTGSAAGMASTPPAATEPKKVKTIAIRPDGSAVMAPQPAAPASKTPPAASRTGAQSSTAAPANAPTRTAALAPAASAPAAAVGTHVVQVASQKSEEDAQASFRALQAKYPTVLGSRQPLIRRIDLGERGVFYRVQVGPFASADQANDLCGSLKSAGGQCIVQRN